MFATIAWGLKFELLLCISLTDLAKVYNKNSTTRIAQFLFIQFQRVFVPYPEMTMMFLTFFMCSFNTCTCAQCYGFWVLDCDAGYLYLATVHGFFAVMISLIIFCCLHITDYCWCNLFIVPCFNQAFLLTVVPVFWSFGYSPLSVQSAIFSVFLIIRTMSWGFFNHAQNEHVLTMWTRFIGKQGKQFSFGSD